MRIINLVDKFDKVNFGIWNAACSTTSKLLLTYGVESELWFPEQNAEIVPVANCKLVSLAETRIEYLLSLVQEKKLSPNHDIIVSHGCWRYPTLLASALKNKGFNWVYVPHGMLEPWSLQQKYWIKKLYFWWREYPNSQKATLVRAVGEPEEKTLKKQYQQTILIPNGVDYQMANTPDKPNKKSVLFMARLHYKKGIIPLVKAWVNSRLFANNAFELLIAGPDDGELQHLQELLGGNVSENIHYLGAVYGDEKKKLLQKSSYYILPSVSEGFPTSVLEAMSFGLLPIITEGCNFPTAFTEGIALETKQDYKTILTSLNGLTSHNDEWRKQIQQKALDFVNKNYTLSKIAQLQYETYTNLLENI